MKRFGFVLMVAATVLLAVSPAFGKGMMFGIKAGINLADWTGDDVGETSMRTTMLGGVSLNYAITEIFSIQPEVLYTMKGPMETGSEGDVNFKLGYIEIPLLLKATIPTDGKIKPSLYAGPGFGFLLSAKASDGTEVDIKDQLESSDIGIIAGVGIDYKVNETGAITFDARYEVGMTSIAKGDGDDTADVKNSVFSFMIGYAFAL